MNNPAPPPGMAGETLVETARLILQCPISHSYEEGVIMEVVEFLRDAGRDKHALWGYFHSIPWPPAFFTVYPDGDGNERVARQGVVVFTVDCRTVQHAKSLLKALRTHLSRVYGSAGHAGANFSAFIHQGERPDWSAS